MPQHILLVDDEPDLLKALVVRLEVCGYSCDTASHGAAALQKIQTHQPDLVLVDLLMPVMDGYEFCRKFKAEPRTASIPVVIVTAVPERAMKFSAKELGACFVLHKPFDFHNLLAIVQSLLASPQSP